MAMDLAEAGRISADAQLRIRKALFEKIVVEIPARIRAAAAQGETCLEVMRIDPHESFKRKWYSHLLMGPVRRPQNLVGAAKDVFDYCREKGWKPRIRYWEYGHASEGSAIEIHW